jgi:hypothetical protein
VTNQLLREKKYLREQVYVQDWDVQELSELLRTVARQLAESRPLCIFLDSLDEYERKANPRQLLDLIHDLSLGKIIKICVSSRPEQHSSNELDGKRFLRLQDLTKPTSGNMCRASLKKSTTAEIFPSACPLKRNLQKKSLARQMECFCGSA